MLRLAIFTLISIMIVWPSIEALDLEKGSLDIHGEVSQGYIKTTTNEYLLKDSARGSFEFSEMSVNVSKDFKNNLRIGAQLISRNFGLEGNFDTALDWGYGDYKFCEEFGIRAGKVRLPKGFYNEYRDVDSGRNSIFLDQGLYPEDFRSLVLAYEGLGFYGNFFSDDKGDVEYHLYFGTLTIPDNFYQNDRLWNNLNSPESKFETELLAGFQFIYNSPIDGLRFQISNLRYRGAMDLGISNTFGTTTYEDAYQFKSIQNNAGIEYVLDNTTFIVEVMTIQADSAASPGYTAAAQGVVFAPATATTPALTLANTALSRAVAGGSNDTLSWYLGVGHQCSEKFGIMIKYGVIKNKQQSALFANHRRDFCLSNRYDIDANWRLKMEYHHLRGKLGVRGELSEFNLSADNEDWGLFAAKLSFSF